MSLTPGQSLLHYRLIEQIGAGGMGVVYRATDMKLRREVAIKVLPDDVSRDEERLARFEREAHVLAALNHSGIASIHGLEESNGIRFLVLEYVQGATLADRLKQGALPVREALGLARQIAEALGEAHQRAIVHRDLKPANIKLTPDGKAKVLDFGLAKAVPSAGAVNDSQAPTSGGDMTWAGVILGTAPYMSPEQARGDAVDSRTDVFAFGAVLFEMLTGLRAFDGKTYSEVLAAVLELDPAWEELPVETPNKARDLMRRCLQKDLRQRQQHIGDARLEIEESLANPSSEHRPSSRRSKAWPMVVVGIAVGIILGVGVERHLIGSTDTPGRTRHFEMLMPANTQLRVVSAMAVSPDGTHVAYIARHERDVPVLTIRNLDSNTSVQISNANWPDTPFFSPDGQWVGHFVGDTLRKASVDGGESQPICEIPPHTVRGATWGSKGSIVFANQEGLWIVPADGTPEILATPDRDKGQKTFFWPEFLPGGDAVLFTIGTRDMATYDGALVAVLDLKSGTIGVVIEGGTRPRYATTGHLLFAREANILAAPFDLNKRQVTGPTFDVVHGVNIRYGNGLASYAVSNDGMLAFIPGSKPLLREIVWVDREGTGERILDGVGFSELRLSPDGTKLAYSQGPENCNIWIHNLMSGKRMKLAGPDDNHLPTWTPNGSRVVFRSDQTGQEALYWRDADGGEETEQLLDLDGIAFVRSGVSWMPDGRSFVYERESAETGWDIWLHSLEDSRS